MKLKLAAVALALSALAPVANATVQPSFNDNAPIEASTAVRSAATYAGPQPSFNDNAPIAQGATGILVAGEGKPVPSFNG
jgi:hypothetical protein